MTLDDARAINLSLPGAVEGAHHGHPDFRIDGKIFGSLQPQADLAVLRLPLEMAEALAQESPGKFTLKSRSNGGWLGIHVQHMTAEEFRPLAELAIQSRKK